MNSYWVERVIDSVAARSREFLGLGGINNSAANYRYIPEDFFIRN